jgi:hypothetical protein
MVNEYSNISFVEWDVGLKYTSISLLPARTRRLPKLRDQMRMITCSLPRHVSPAARASCFVNPNQRIYFWSLDLISQRRPQWILPGRRGFACV